MRFPKKTGDMERTTLVINGQKIYVEVARSEEEKERGLMGRKNIKSHHGMLFVESGDSHPALWMKDTPTPLSAAWISAKGKILQIVDMEPFSEDVHVAPLHTAYALEMKKGAFASIGINKGDIVEFPSGFQK